MPQPVEPITVTLVKGVRFLGLQRPHYSTRCEGRCSEPGARCRTAEDVVPTVPAEGAK